MFLSPASSWISVLLGIFPLPKDGTDRHLVGQSYGAAIASLMAAARPKGLKGLVLLSGYFGESDRRPNGWSNGAQLLPFIPRDLQERRAGGRRSTLPARTSARGHRAGIRVPLHILHGDADDFAPIETAERFHERSAATGPRRPVPARAWRRPLATTVRPMR